jgi:hypothetical protein
VTINDVPLDQVTRHGEIIYPFQTEFFAGDIRIAVVSAGEILASGMVQVDPDKSKLTRDEYAEMVAGVARATTALYRFGLVTLQSSTDAIGVQSEIVTLELIRANFDGFERAVSRIADQPVSNFHSTLFTVEIMKARRVDDRALNRAIRSGQTRSATELEIKAAPKLVTALGGRWVPAIEERRRQERTDVYENRALLGFNRRSLSHVSTAL